MEKSLFRVCRWKGCKEHVLREHHLCSFHAQVPASSTLPAWIRSLPLNVGIGLATSLLYDALKYLYRYIGFSMEAACEYREICDDLYAGEMSAVERVAKFIECGYLDGSYCIPDGKVSLSNRMKDFLQRAAQNLPPYTVSESPQVRKVEHNIDRRGLGWGFRRLWRRLAE
ncbi:hypothetical protein [Burkholderia vietnamiensis]|uniref:hypothetical protein n=1 Tax=Burkholderia vietnamiensis TaxID=60552 RepID=UPI001592C827|nr:hypothetical protein [Burkholderia vietnamiensis]